MNLLVPIFPYALAALIFGLAIGVTYTASDSDPVQCTTDIECCTMFDDCDQPIFGGAQ